MRHTASSKSKPDSSWLRCEKNKNFSYSKIPKPDSFILLRPI
jgi:hypothetical protein